MLFCGCFVWVTGFGFGFVSLIFLVGCSLIHKLLVVSVVLLGIYLRAGP